MHVDLSDDERAALIGLLAGLIERDPFPESERVQQLRRILTKLRTAPLAQVNAADGACEAESTEPADVEEAEALGLAADFPSDDPEGRAPRHGLKTAAARSPAR